MIHNMKNGKAGINIRNGKMDVATKLINQILAK